MITFNIFKRFNYEKLLTHTLYLGTLILFSGKIWIEDGSAYRTQVYIWFFLPALVALCLTSKNFRDYKPTISEFFLILLSIWVLIRSLETNALPEQLKTSALIFLFFYAIFKISKKESAFINLTIITILANATGAAATIFYQYIILEQDFSYRAYRLYQLGFKEYADLGHPVMAGIYYGFFSVISCTLLFKFKLNLKIKMLLILATAILLTYVLLTYSRGAWISVLSCLAIIVLTTEYRFKKPFIFLSIILFFIFVLHYRSLIISEFVDQGLSGRFQIWKDIWSHIQNRPLVGFGSEYEYLYSKEDLITLQKPTHAHSLYLQIWFEYGLIGLMLYLISVIVVLIKIIKIRKSSLLTWLSIIGITYISCNALTDIHSLLTLPGPYWISLLFPIALSNAITRRYTTNQLTKSENS
ncbi:O-antigen ligase family protein [Aurantivibrio infirmus]